MASRSPRSSAKPSAAKQSKVALAAGSAEEQLADLLHQTVCQELTGICFLASAAALRHGKVDREVGSKFEEIADLIQQAGAHLAEIVHRLGRPSAD